MLIFAVLWYLLPVLVVTGAAIGTHLPVILFPFVLMVAIPFQTMWVASFGLTIPLKIAPEFSYKWLVGNILNVHYVIAALQRGKLNQD